MVIASKSSTATNDIVSLLNMKRKEENVVLSNSAIGLLGHKEIEDKHATSVSNELYKLTETLENVEKDEYFKKCLYASSAVLAVSYLSFLALFKKNVSSLGIIIHSSLAVISLAFCVASFVYVISSFKNQELLKDQYENLFKIKKPNSAGINSSSRNIFIDSYHLASRSDRDIFVDDIIDKSIRGALHKSEANTYFKNRLENFFGGYIKVEASALGIKRRFPFMFAHAVVLYACFVTSLIAMAIFVVKAMPYLTEQLMKLTPQKQAIVYIGVIFTSIIAVLTVAIMTIHALSASSLAFAIDDIERENDQTMRELNNMRSYSPVVRTFLEFLDMVSKNFNEPRETLEPREQSQDLEIEATLYSAPTVPTAPPYSAPTVTTAPPFSATTTPLQQANCKKNEDGDISPNYVRAPDPGVVVRSLMRGMSNLIAEMQEKQDKKLSGADDHESVKQKPQFKHEGLLEALDDMAAEIEEMQDKKLSGESSVRLTADKVEVSRLSHIAAQNSYV